MKDYENKLLTKLRKDHYSQDEPLKNVKSALGSVAHVAGNPMTKTEISLQITTIFVDVGLGIIIPPAGLPPALQTSLPVYVFGLTDYYGGFLRLRTFVPVQQGWFLMDVLAAGGFNVGIACYNAAPVSALMVPFINAGDMIICYGDLINFVAVVIIHCNNVSYGTFLNSFVSDLITIDSIRYIVPAANINQFINPIVFGTQTLFGKVATDNIDPRAYITSKDFQQQIADIPINLPIDKTLMIGFQLDVFCQQLSWVLFVKKVEPLTHKYKR